jgi:PqqD family protein of HPr-rel-A system
MAAESSDRWHAVPDAALAWREWGGQTVVFNAETGSTHLLNPLAAEILRRLATQGPTSAFALGAGLVDEGDGDDPAKWTRAIAQILSEFMRVGLAQPETR